MTPPPTPLPAGADRRPRRAPGAAGAPHAVARTRAPDGPSEELRALRVAQTINSIGSWLYRVDAQSLYMSDELLSLFGMTRADNSPGWSAVVRCVHPGDQSHFVEQLQELHDTGRSADIRFRVYRSRHGSLRWFDARGIAHRDDNGAIIELAGTVTDVTELVQAELDLRTAHTDLVHANNYAQAVISATPDVIHVYQVGTGELSRASQLQRPLIGFTDESVRVMSGETGPDLVSTDFTRRWRDLVAEACALPDGEVVHTSHAVRHADGSVRWLSRRLSPFERDADGVATRLLVVTRDVTSSVAVERQLAHAASHDELTGLANRRTFRARMDEVIADCTGAEARAVALVCDLDGFKRVNDVYGHLAGDAVLREVARRLQASVRQHDLVARLGGDEFAILLVAEPGEQPQHIAARIAQRIIAGVAVPIVYGEHEHRVTASVGTRPITAGMDGDTALSDADSAMYFVKRNGTNGHAEYAPAMRPSSESDDALEAEIRRALISGEVGVGYQPIVGPRTHRIRAVEALLRLRGGDGALLNAGDVVRVAEQRGLILALDEAVRHVACAQVAQWRREPELTELKLNVNCSAKDIARPGFGERVDAVLRGTGLAPQALTIEITETTLLDASAENLHDLRALQARGVGLAIDDFGTGYASLRYLADLPITCIKIDRTFTRDMLTDRTAETLVRATVGLAEQLGINCTAEGIETVAQLDALPDYDRLRVQGYIFSAALDPAQAPPALYPPKA